MDIKWTTHDDANLICGNLGQPICIQIKPPCDMTQWKYMAQVVYQYRIKVVIPAEGHEYFDTEQEAKDWAIPVYEEELKELEKDNGKEQ